MIRDCQRCSLVGIEQLHFSESPSIAAVSSRCIVRLVGVRSAVISRVHNCTPSRESASVLLSQFHLTRDTSGISLMSRSYSRGTELVFLY